MIDARRQQHIYRTQGLDWEVGFDAPGTEYPRHAHEETRLYTVAGSLSIKLFAVDGAEENHELLPGTEFVVAGGQEHEAVAGESGWKYVAAWDPAEAAIYETID